MRIPAIPIASETGLKKTIGAAQLAIPSQANRDKDIVSDLVAIRYDPPEIIHNQRQNKRPVRKTMPSFACKDIGMACKFKTSALTEVELMKKIADHAKSVHKMETVPPDIMAKIKKAIKK